MADAPETVHDSQSDVGSIETIVSDVEAADLCDELRQFHENLDLQGMQDIGTVSSCDVDDHAMATMFSNGLPLLLLRIIMRVRHVILVRHVRS